ncbi:MAG: hypothetical protein KC549_10205, partial [Myxococcales bacterium]|nr:hypothetical protein [Myxococcales bacterium]
VDADAPDADRDAGPLLDAAPADAEVDMEPFEAGPPPYALDAARDPVGLELQVGADWTPILDGRARQKRASMQLEVLPSGRTIRVPLLYVAPTNGCPCSFYVVDGAVTPDVRAVDEVAQSLLDLGIGMVAVGIAPLDQLGPDGEAIAAERLALLVTTGDLRYTDLWLWGYAYIRAATAALTEFDIYRAGRIGAAGRSRGGMAATAAVVHDDRFVALSAWLTPIAALPDGLLPDELRGRARRRLRFDLERLSLPIHHVPALDERRVDVFFHNAANDVVTPGLTQAGELDREFPQCIEPNIGHGVVFRPAGAPVPVTGPFEDTRRAVLEYSLSRGSRLMTPPLLSATLVDDTLTVLARFRTSPRPDNATLWFVFDRPAEGEPDWENVIFESRPMSRLDNATYVITLPIPPGHRTLDAFSYHSDLVQGKPRHVSSAYTRFELIPAF